MQLDAVHSEFCGAIMGDGNLWSNNRKYEITITGNIFNDREYFDFLASTISRKINKKPYYRIRGRGLRLTFYSKKYYCFLIDVVGMKSGAIKCESGFPIPIMSNETFLKSFIRGLFDTDGTVFVSDKKGSPNYPTLEIASSSISLVNDLHKSLCKLGFRAKKRKTTKNGYKVSVYGKKMIAFWHDTIGSSNPYKRARMEDILK